jgi:hypothetical protein
MKIYAASIAALCALHSTAGFVIQAPKALKFQAHATNSYMDALGAGPEGSPEGPPQPAVGGAVPLGVSSELSQRAASTRASPPLASAGRTDSRMQHVNEIWETLSSTIVQGGSLRTWSFESPAVEFVQVLMKTEGRPLNADVELWQGPDNSPQRMGVYIEDGSIRPFSCVIGTPRGSNTIAIRNTAHLEFPLTACVEADVGPAGLGAMIESDKSGRIVQGGAVYTVPFDSSVESVSVLLKTDGRPLNARIELLQGPNNNKQVIELYTEDGLERPFFAVLETPGTGNVVRIVNTATVEFPLTASIEPYQVDTNQQW